MTRYFLIAGVLLVASCNQSADSDKSATDTTLLSTSLVTNQYTAGKVDSAEWSKMPTMSFRDTTHDFGTLHEGETVQHEFEFTNTGKEPLIISAATGSCGCTVADYPREPIAAGKTAVLKVTFSSAGKSGHQEKSVTITTNAQRSVHMLYIKAEVTPANSNEVPTE